jgi:hypothetical protein
MAERLKSEFEELRVHERARVPDFEALLAEVPRRVRHARLLAGSVAIAAAIAAILLWPRHIHHEVTPLSITQWRAPTDFLLNTPGSDLLGELPPLDQSVLNLESL